MHQTKKYYYKMSFSRYKQSRLPGKDISSLGPAVNLLSIVTVFHVQNYKTKAPPELHYQSFYFAN